MSAKRTGRRQRVLELTALGMSIPEISETLGKEGYRYHGERTVWSDQNSDEAKEFVKELQRRQLRDIAQADLPVKLKWRAHLLDKLMPQKIEQKTEQTLDVKKPGWTIKDLMGEYGEAIIGEAVRRRLKSDRGDAGSNTQQPMDTS
jgi:hypothetical protein